MRRSARIPSRGEATRASATCTSQPTAARSARIDGSALASVTTRLTSARSQIFATSTSPSFEPSATTTGRRAESSIARLTSASGRLTLVTPPRDVDAVAADEGDRRVEAVEQDRAERVDERVLQRPQRPAGDDHRDARRRALEDERDRQPVGDHRDLAQLGAGHERPRDRRRRGARRRAGRCRRRPRAPPRSGRWPPSRWPGPARRPRTAARRARCRATWRPRGSAARARGTPATADRCGPSPSRRRSAPRGRRPARSPAPRRAR